MLTLGVVLLVVAAVLLLIEAHAATGGLIGSGAIVALLAGITLTLVGAGAGWLVVLAVALSAGLVSTGALLVAGRSLLNVRRQRARAGTEAMVGHVGVVRVGACADQVYVDGALWRAQPSVLLAGSALHDGDRVVVERVNGLTLCVRKADEWELNP